MVGELEDEEKVLLDFQCLIVGGGSQLKGRTGHALYRLENYFNAEKHVCFFFIYCFFLFSSQVFRSRSCSEAGMSSKWDHFKINMVKSQQDARLSSVVEVSLAHELSRPINMHLS